jgi:hypothetical protein
MIRRDLGVNRRQAEVERNLDSSISSVSSMEQRRGLDV